MATFGRLTSAAVSSLFFGSAFAVTLGVSSFAAFRGKMTAAAVVVWGVWFVAAIVISTLDWWVQRKIEKAYRGEAIEYESPPGANIRKPDC